MSRKRSVWLNVIGSEPKSPGLPAETRLRRESGYPADQTASLLSRFYNRVSSVPASPRRSTVPPTAMRGSREVTRVTRRPVRKVWA